MADEQRWWFGSREVTLRLSVNWFSCIVGAAILLIAAYAYVSEQHRPIVQFAGVVLGGTAALLAFANTLDTRSEQLRQAEVLRQAQKKQLAFDFIHRWNDPQFFHTRKNAGAALIEFKNIPEEHKKTFLTAERDKVVNSIDMLNFLETISLAIHQDMADEETLRRFFRSIVIGLWQNGSNFIEARRAERSTPRLFIETQRLFDQWSKL